MGKRKANSPFYHLNHIGVVVRDLDKAVEHLESIGLESFRKPPPMAGQPVFRGKPSDAKVKGLMTYIGGVELEVAQPVEGESSQQEYLDAKGEGLHHLGFLVDNLDKEVANLLKKGFKVMLKGEQKGEKWAYFETRIAGLILQLTEKS